MKRWRPLTWFLLSLACFVAAVYFWQLGDKWQAEKIAKKPAAQAATSPAIVAANPQVFPGEKGETVSVKSSSTAPVVELNPPATNAVVPRPTNAFPYRLS